MAAPTIIRMKQLTNGFAVVVTYYDHDGFNASCQRYSYALNGKGTILILNSIWRNECDAKAIYDSIKNDLPKVSQASIDAFNKARIL